MLNYASGPFSCLSYWQEKCLYCPPLPVPPESPEPPWSLPDD